MRGFLLFAIALFFIRSAPAIAGPQACQATGSPLCSLTLYATGSCDDGDRLAVLTAAGDNHGTQMVEPWEPSPITIVGVHIVLVEGTMKYAFAGNGYAPDVMRWLDERETFYPAGTGFAFPAAGTKTHIDLHYSCTNGNFQAFYTLYYTVAKQPVVAEAHQ